MAGSPALQPIEEAKSYMCEPPGGEAVTRVSWPPPAVPAVAVPRESVELNVSVMELATRASRLRTGLEDYRTQKEAERIVAITKAAAERATAVPLPPVWKAPPTNNQIHTHQNNMRNNDAFAVKVRGNVSRLHKELAELNVPIAPSAAMASIDAVGA